MTIVANNSLTVSNVNDGSITHTAYAYSADGTDRFTTVYPNLNLLSNSLFTDPIKTTVDSNSAFYGLPSNVMGSEYVSSSYTDLTISSYYISKLELPIGVYTSSITIANNSETVAKVEFILMSGTADTNISPSVNGVNVTWETAFSNPRVTINIPANSNARYTFTFTAKNTNNTGGGSTPQFLIFREKTAIPVARYSKPKLEKGSTATPWMPSASEATTSDYPSYIGTYSDTNVDGIADPNKYTWTIFKGNDGIGIQTTVITYAISTSGTTAPSTGWTNTVPTLVKGQYLWTKTVWTYTDNSTETGYSVTYISKDGTDGDDGLPGKDGVGIATTTITYVGSTNGTTAPTSGWTSTVPTVAAGSYLWTKTVWTYTDNTSETGYSVARMGLKGDKGDQGDPGIKGSDGTSGIIVSSVAPDSPQAGQLWQDTSTTPQLVKKWTGNEWVIWEFYAQNLKADSLSALSANLGDVSAGTYTSWFTEINAQSGNNMLNGIYLFNGRIRSLVIQSSSTIDKNTVLGSGVLPTVHGTEQYAGRIRYFAGDFNLGITPNQLLHDMETYGYWSEYDIAGTTGTSALVSEIIGYSDGISISGNVLVNNITVESDWISMPKGRYKLAYSRVAIAFDITGAGETFVQMGNLPQGVRPPFDRWFSAAATGTSTVDDRHVQVRASDGAVILWSPKSGTRYQSEISFTL